MLLGSMIIFIYGPDVYRSRQYLDKIIQKFKTERDPAGYNLVILNADVHGSNSVMTEILATPFLSERRMVVVKNMVQAKSVELRLEITKRIKKKTLPDSTILVIWEDTDEFKAKDAKTFFALLREEKYQEHFPALKPNEAIAWLKQEASVAACELESLAASCMVEALGTDSLTLRQILNQLIAYKKTGLIRQADVALFVEQGADDNIFTLVDAIINHQTKMVYRMIRAQYNKGEDPGFIFLMLIRQFRIMLELRDLFERDELDSSDGTAKRLGLHPFVVKKTLPMIKQYTTDQLRGIYDQLLVFDRHIKTGFGGQSVLLDILVNRL